jgi:hypothetical protein
MSELSSKTKRLYTTAYSRLLNYGYEPSLTFEELNKILDEFNIKQVTRNNYFKALLYYHKTNGDVINDILYVEIQNEIKKINNEALKKAREGKLSKEKEINYLKWDDILNVFEKIKKDNDIQKIALVAVYILQPPRRILDYSNMIYAKRKPPKLDSEKNYFINTKNPRFIFNKYKTAQTYKTQEINITNKELLKILNDYVNTYNIKSGSSLFKLEQDNFTQKLRNIFYEYSNKYISVNLLRHSYISYQTKNNLIDLALDRHNLAYSMAHSDTTNLNYFINEQYLNNKIL